MVNHLFKFDELEIKNKAHEALSEFRNIVGNPHIKQEKFITELIENLYIDNDLTKVNIVPVRCGFGKSLGIKLFLESLIKGKMQEDIFDGVIVVSDKIDRLEEIACFGNLKTMCSLLRYYDKKSDLIDAEKFSHQLKKQYMYPILLMTAQRYERLNAIDRMQLYKWKNGERKLVIFDEKPFIYNQVVIDVDFMNCIKKTIDEVKETHDKQFLINEFRKVETKLEMLKDDLAAKYEVMWVKGRCESIFNDIEVEYTFLNIIKRNLSSDVFNRINKLLMFYKSGGLFVNKKNKKAVNKRFFILLEDNIEKFDIKQVKCWIFDATSREDIEYNNVKLFKFMDVDDIKENNLKIIKIKVNMSKQSMKEKNYAKVKALNKYIKKSFNSGNLLIASYCDFIKKIHCEDINNKLYFGNIKGSNNYKHITTMLHVGWNRQPDYYYLGLYLLLNKNLITLLNDSDENLVISKMQEIRKFKILRGIKTTIFENEDINKIMLSKILGDFEQNIFRTKLRDFSSNDEVTIYIFDSHFGEEIIKMFESKYKIKVQTVLPEEFIITNISNRNNQKHSVSQKLVKWWSEYNWTTELHISEILKFNNVTQKQFNKAKEKNNQFKQFINNHTGSKKQYYTGIRM